MNSVLKFRKSHAPFRLPMIDIPTIQYPDIKTKITENHSTVVVSGDWNIQCSAQGEDILNMFQPEPEINAVTIDLAEVQNIDTAGAWLISRLRRKLENEGLTVNMSNMSATSKQLIEAVSSYEVPASVPKVIRSTPFDIFEYIGRLVVTGVKDVGQSLHILGVLTGIVGIGFFRPKRLRINAIFSHFYKMGVDAVPIMLLLSFLIGAILSQQAGFYLEKFGADVFVVDLIGVLVLRELGVLLTAILIAGRSGSAFTAEIGSMKMREEIDALNVIGLSIAEVLILPRMFALIIALPVLTLFADLAAIAGGLVAAWFFLDISPSSFVVQIQEKVAVGEFIVGVVKAPVMGAVIAIIASVEGMKVTGSTESLGYQTTQSVVKSIFMVILVDGIFAIFFGSIGI